MKLFLSNSASEAFNLYKTDAPEVAEKIRVILKDTLLHPAEGIGAPVRLDGVFSGFWQRTFAPGEIIVYSFDDAGVKVASIGKADKAFKALNLEAYSSEDEKAVMAQMAANRGRDGEPKVGIFWYNR